MLLTRRRPSVIVKLREGSFPALISGDITGVAPLICGRGWITAVADVIVEADDPLPTGFTVADIW